MTSFRLRDRRTLTRLAVAGLATVLVASMTASTPGSVSAQTTAGDPFTDVPAVEIDRAQRSAAIDEQGEMENVAPTDARTLAMDRDAMEALLADAPGPDSADALRIELPAPDGTSHTFDIRRNVTLSPELAARFPSIRTYDGRGVTDPAASITLDLTPHGFHAQVLSPNGHWYIDPSIRQADRLHVSYDREDLPAPEDAWTEAELPDDLLPASGEAGPQQREPETQARLGAQCGCIAS